MQLNAVFWMVSRLANNAPNFAWDGHPAGMVMDESV
jgi:hypothetical protein